MEWGGTDGREGTVHTTLAPNSMPAVRFGCTKGIHELFVEKMP